MSCDLDNSMVVCEPYPHATHERSEPKPEPIWCSECNDAEIGVEGEICESCIVTLVECAKCDDVGPDELRQFTGAEWKDMAVFMPSGKLQALAIARMEGR